MNNYGQFGGYNIDICLCIDRTGSMGPIINTVKSNALNLYSDIKNCLAQKQKQVAKLRIRVIWFGDYAADGKDAMLVSPFLNMPEEMDKFEACVNGIMPDGGGDEPEDGLEALAYAIRSDWCKGFKRRHIIALFTDASAHALGFGKGSPAYPKVGMPENFAQLSAMWGSEATPGEMNEQAKRLLLFAPDVTFWNDIATGWNNVICSKTASAEGLADVSYLAMMNSISNSV